MKLDKKEIIRLAMTNIKTNTYDPYEALVAALETWLKKNGLCISKLPSEGKREA